jgi:hypothetical protein
MHHLPQENVMTNETPRQEIARFGARAHPATGRTARTTARGETQATRMAMAHRTAAQLSANLLLNRARTRAGRTWESAMCSAMPQSGWLAATERDFMAWLDAGGFAAAGELPPAGAGAKTKTAA